MSKVVTHPCWQKHLIWRVWARKIGSLTLWLTSPLRRRHYGGNRVVFTISPSPQSRRQGRVRFLTQKSKLVSWTLTPRPSSTNILGMSETSQRTIHLSSSTSETLAHWPQTRNTGFFWNFQKPPSTRGWHDFQWQPIPPSCRTSDDEFGQPQNHRLKWGFGLEISSKSHRRWKKAKFPYFRIISLPLHFQRTPSLQLL